MKAKKLQKEAEGIRKNFRIRRQAGSKDTYIVYPKKGSRVKK